MRDIAAECGISKSTVERHKTGHLLAQFTQETDDFEARLAAAQQADQRQVKQLRWQARAVMRAMQGWGQVRSPEAWQTLCTEAQQHYHTGEFLINRLGAERYLDPQLMAVLWHLRQGLITEYGGTSPSILMLIDLAIMSYYNALRLQGWTGDLAIWIEHECFAHETLRVARRREYGAQVNGPVVEERLKHFREQLFPLLEWSQQQVIRLLHALKGTRPSSAPPGTHSWASQVNVAQQQVNGQYR